MEVGEVERMSAGDERGQKGRNKEDVGRCVGEK